MPTPGTYNKSGCRSKGRPARKRLRTEIGSSANGNGHAKANGRNGLKQSSSEVSLTWTDNSNNETSFKIERSADAGLTFAEVATVGENVTAYTDVGLTPLSTYVYRVRASNSAGDSTYSDPATVITPP